jgi:hypothetical protein
MRPGRDADTPVPPGEVLSVTLGALLSPKGMGGVADLLSYMTDDQLWSHQPKRATDK